MTYLTQDLLSLLSVLPRDHQDSYLGQRCLISILISVVRKLENLLPTHYLMVLIGTMIGNWASLSSSTLLSPASGHQATRGPARLCRKWIYRSPWRIDRGAQDSHCPPQWFYSNKYFTQTWSWKILSVIDPTGCKGNQGHCLARWVRVSLMTERSLIFSAGISCLVELQIIKLAKFWRCSTNIFNKYLPSLSIGQEPAGLFTR